MRRYEVPQGIGKNRKLNHKNPANCRNKIELFKFDCHDKGHGQKQMPENDRSKRQQKQFSLGFSDFDPQRFTHDNEIDNAENCAQHETFAKRFQIGNDKDKANDYRCCHRPGTIFFL